MITAIRLDATTHAYFDRCLLACDTVLTSIDDVYPERTERPQQPLDIVTEIAGAEIAACAARWRAWALGRIVPLVEQHADEFRALALDTLVIVGFQLPASIAFVLSDGATYVGVWRIVALTYFLFAIVYVVSYRRGRFLEGATATPASAIG